MLNQTVKVKKYYEKSWNEKTVLFEMFLPKSFVSYSGKRYSSSGNDVYSSSTRAKLFTMNDTLLEVGDVIEDLINGNKFSIISITRNLHPISNQFYFMKYELEFNGRD